MRMWFRPVKGIAFLYCGCFLWQSGNGAGTGEKEFSFSETYFGI